MDKSSPLETLLHWVSDHSDNFFDRLYDLIEAASSDERTKIESLYPDEVFVYEEFKNHNWQAEGSFWDLVGLKPSGEGYVTLETERQYLAELLFEACCRCPNCKETFDWDTMGTYFIVECCGYQYRAYPVRLYMEIEKVV